MAYDNVDNLDATRRWVRGRMGEMGVTQEQVAKHLGFDRAHLSRYLRGHLEIAPQRRQRLAELLEVLEEAEIAASEARHRVLKRAGFITH